MDFTVEIDVDITYITLGDLQGFINEMTALGFDYDTAVTTKYDTYSYRTALRITEDRPVSTPVSNTPQDRA